MKLVGRVLSVAAPFVFVALLATPAFAHHREVSEQPKLPFSHAPEIDPAALGSAAALLAGGALLLNARRARASR